MTKKMAGLVAWSCAAWIAVVLVGGLYLLIDLGTFKDLAVDNLSLRIKWFSVSNAQWYAMWGLSALYMSLNIVGTWYLFKAFRRFARGDWFDFENSRYLRRFATLLMLQGALQPVTLALASVLLSLNHPAGEHTLSLAVGSRDVGLVVAGLIMWVLADLLVEGTRAADENRQFV